MARLRVHRSDDVTHIFPGHAYGSRLKVVIFSASGGGALFRQVISYQLVLVERGPRCNDRIPTVQRQVQAVNAIGMCGPTDSSLGHWTLAFLRSSWGKAR